MRLCELAHTATITPVARLESGAAKYSINAGQTDLAFEASSIEVPCRFESRSELAYRDRNLEEGVRGRITCVAGTANRSIQNKQGVATVVLDGSKVAVKGESFVVSGSEDVEDGKGNVIARRLMLAGPTHG